MAPHSFRPAAALAALALVLSACSGPRAVAPTGPAAPSGPAYPTYETFDAASHPAVAPPAAPTAHDVPARVMEGRVSVPGVSAPAPLPTEPTTQQVEGHRVQIFTSASRETAERIRGEAQAWWQTARSRPGAPREMEVTVVYLQPYYRVRMGGFASEADAEAALALVRTQYPEAFLVPDLITVGN